MIAIRLTDCASRTYGDILKIIHAPVTEEAAGVLQKLLPDLHPAKSERVAYHAGGKFYVRGEVVGWVPVAEKPPEPAPASLLTKARSLAGAAIGIAGDLAAGRNPIASPELAEQRVRVCQSCPMLSAGICSRCGCPVDRKAAVASERCPDGKW